MMPVVYFGNFELGIPTIGFGFDLQSPTFASQYKADTHWK